MNKSWIIAALLIAAGVGAYLYSQGKTPADLVNTAKDAASSVADTAKDAAAGVAGTATDAAAAAAKAAEDVAAAAKAKVSEEAAAVAKAAEEAAAAATDTSAIGSLLSVDSFDAGKVSEMIDGSSLGAMKKTALKAAIAKAGDNPDMIKAVIEQIKGALGM